jgi:hypothetical protein
LIFFSNPLITAITTSNTPTPSATPATEIRVITDTNVPFGFKYRRAMNQLNFMPRDYRRTGSTASASPQEEEGEFLSISFTSRRAARTCGSKGVTTHRIE